jgi:CHRD domain
LGFGRIVRVRGLVLLGIIAALAVPVAAAPADSVVLHARLTGAFIGTSSKGSGTATITITPAKVCWKFAYRGLVKPGDSGMRLRPPPKAGVHKRSVFPLTANTSMSPACVPTTKWGPSSADWAQKIAAEPLRFYVSIADSKYPKGAIGGPLKP